MYQKGNLKLILPYLYTLKTLIAIYKVHILMTEKRHVSNNLKHAHLLFNT